MNAAIAGRLRDIAEDLEMGCPPDVLTLDALDLYRFADALDHDDRKPSTRSTSVNPLLQKSAVELVSFVLAIGAGYLARAGVWTAEDATGYVAAAATALVLAGWAIYQRSRDEAVIEAALAAPAGTSREMLSRSL